MPPYATWTRLAGLRFRSSRALLAGVLMTVPALLPAVEIELTAERWRAGDVIVEDVRANLAGEAVAVTAERVIRSGKEDVVSPSLQCPELRSGTGAWCAGGRWSLSWVPADERALPISGVIEKVRRDDGQGVATTSVAAAGLVAHARLEWDPDRVKGLLEWRDQPLTALSGLPFPGSPLDWIQEGSTAGKFEFGKSGSSAPEITGRMSVAGLSFDSPEGRHAAVGLELNAGFGGSLGDDPTVSARLEIRGGELLIDRFYAAFDDMGMEIDTQVTLAGEELEIASFRIADGRSVEIRGSGRLNVSAPGDSLNWRVEHLEAGFPLAYERYLEPVLAPMSLDQLTVTGRILWQGSGRAGAFPEGRFEIADLSVVDTGRGRFAVTGLDGEIQAGASPTDSRLDWRGLLLQRINLGGGTARIHTGPGLFRLAEPLELDVLGGRLVLDAAAVRLPPADAPEAEPQVTLQASLDDMEMGALTQALDWPRFEGRISGTIPGVSLEEGVLAVGGRIRFEVFDGSLELTGLRIERPFGVLPSLAADLIVDDVDLQRLTQAFSFGRISGRMDGYMRNLRMLDWEPVAFDAWFGTPSDQTGTNAISRQAVNHLTTIGGGGPTAALTGPVLRLFSRFSYRRLGMGCTLQDNVCVLRGLDDDGEGVLILEGSGIPKIMIRAYNRRMDFPQLVANLAAASEGEGVRIGDGD